MKTSDGKKIILDNDFEGKGRLGYNSGFDLVGLLPYLLIFFPLALLSSTINTDYSRIIISYGSLIFLVMWVVSSIVLRKLVYVYCKPWVIGFVKLFFVSRYMYFLSCLMFLIYANPPYFWYGLFAAAWIISESIFYYENSRVTDEQIIRAYKRSFKLADTEGNWLYDPIKRVPQLPNFKGRERWERIVWWIEMPLVALVVFAGPFLFLRSFLYRDNFEPRALIICFITLAMAMSLRQMNNELLIDRRALKLKQQGKF